MMNFNMNSNANISKISPAVYNPYVKAMKYNKPSASPEKGAKAGSFDMVEFDFAQIFEAAKANASEKLAAELAAANPDANRVNLLQGQYTGDSNPVSFSEIAGAIVGA